MTEHETNAVALLRRWRKLYADLDCPDHEDGHLFSETGAFCRQLEYPRGWFFDDLPPPIERLS